MKLKSLLNDDGSIDKIKCVEFNKKVSLNDEYGPCLKPSLELSKKIGIDVHQEYNLPYNWNSDDLEYITFTVRENVELTDELFDIILRLNPGIDKLYDGDYDISQRRYISYKYDILLGMGSLFNLDDIKEYINGGFGYIKRQDPKYSTKLQLIENRIKDYIQYVVSYKTLDIVFNHLFK